MSYASAALASVCALALALGPGAVQAAAAGGSFQFGPSGTEAGQIGIYGSSGMAIDRASGDVYVSDLYDNRVEEFDASGEFLLGWGWGVANGANEFQTCTTACQAAPENRSAAGAVDYPEGVAVDQSTGDVYVVDFGNNRVDKYDSTGKFLLTFGGHVNKNGTDVCAAGEECQGGTEGTGSGEFSEVFRKAYIAVGPGGDVYVGDRARVQVFEPSGAWKESIPLSGLSSDGAVTALAVNAAGDVFVKDEGVPGVRELEPPLFLESPTKFDENSEAVESIVLDASGDLFISENHANYGEPCTCDLEEYSPAGQHLETFGGRTLDSMNSALAFGEPLDELLVYGTDAAIGNTEYGHNGVWAFTVPPPGPLIEAASEQATPELRGAATLHATVDPEGSPTEVSFEYVDDAHFDASGYANAASTAPVALAESNFNDEPVEVALPQKTLLPGVTYHWRAVAHNSRGTTTGEDQSFDEIPPAEIEGPWVTDVAATSATLSAKVDPLGAGTSFRLEYGTSSSYGHVLAGDVGESIGFVRIDRHIQELQPGTIYHYRVVTESEVGIVEGPDREFTTQLAGGAFALPDGRAWELVSPASKGGALIEEIGPAQAASDGGGIVYSASEPIGENIAGHAGNPNPFDSATLLSRRTADGWRTQDISPNGSLPPEGESATNLVGAAEAFYAFTPSLSQGVLEPRYGLLAPQSKDASEKTLYVRDNGNNTFQPLVTEANVPAGTKWVPGGSGNSWEQMSFEAATSDLSHILFSDWAALTPEAITAKGAGEEYQANLYEWSGGHLQLVNILPDGETQPGASFGAGAEGGGSNTNPWAMSADGRWVVFRYNQIGSGGPWYVRDVVEHKTVPFGRTGDTRFQTMSRDGARIFYLQHQAGVGAAHEQEGELYLFDPASGTATDLTADHPGSPNAYVQNMVVGISEDGSYVYLVAKGVLANGATLGQDNLYLLHLVNGEWQTTFIATLSAEDENDWHDPSPQGSEVKSITSRVAPNGRFLAFMSDRPLTGYDNRDARSGQRDEEVYLYDAQTNRLVCASCNPNGARPTGVFESSGPGGEVLMDQSKAWLAQGTAGRWLAATIAPGWHTNWSTAFARTAYLADDGRLFFNGSDALVPQDTNGVADVYEYEPAGVGSCTSASRTFDERSSGCVGLISSGQSSSESTFLDASESGDDVFFITAAKLAGEDYDTANDVYDAHVCAAAVPCRAELVAPPPCTSGDSCKAAPSPQPELFGSPASATFSGAGNVVAEASKSTVESKRKPRRHVRRKHRRRRPNRRSAATRNGNGVRR